MQNSTKVVVAVIALVVVIKIIGMATAKKEQEALGAEVRVDSTIEELGKINGFKNDFKGEMSIFAYRKELLSMIHRFERNRGVRVLKSSIFSEGPILLNEF